MLKACVIVTHRGRRAYMLGERRGPGSSSRRQPQDAGTLLSLVAAMAGLGLEADRQRLETDRQTDRHPRDTQTERDITDRQTDTLQIDR